MSIATRGQKRRKANPKPGSPEREREREREPYRSKNNIKLKYGGEKSWGTGYRLVRDD